ncbi:MAG: HlyC/CorC family transporter [Alphaproteobacteria bacterium]|nr:HlyC/CorC family transporter [Alphaproteobacteria bacterium]MBV9014169.1 HlyC/CorC family transporter [Alphaproteobacteria bacterium]MBV9152999.1 HlyC/CorC family transporter [Alphaproteobacteria bacterium]MBV9587079.1 HlyC/CorC family transporter [Alphaproteobacteria bacterium]
MLTLHLAIVFLLILLNGFFAMAEIALVSARPARLQPMAEGGSAGAEAALELKADPSRLLATVQIGITIIAVLLGSFGEATLGEELQDYFGGFTGFLARYAHAISMAVVVLGISYFSLILGELVPKRVAMLRPEGIAAAMARFMRALARIGAPIEWLLSTTTDLLLKLLPLRGEPAPVTDQEIGFMLREGVAAGHIPQAETAIVEMALRLGDRRVSAVMTPRTQIEFLDLDDPEEEVRRRIRDSAYSRFPVVQGGTHQLAGIVHVKDLLAASLDGQPFNLRAALRPPLFLPNTVTVLRALEVFKTSSEPMALVVDEYGDLEGLVTLTDILEALVGELPEAGETDPRIVKREDGTMLIDGMVGLDELKQVLSVAQLPGEDPDFHTLGGYLMARLNRVPMVADRVSAGDWRFEVVEMDGRRVDRVLVAPVSSTARR